MRLTKPIETMTAEEKAILIANMKAAGLFEDDGFPGVAGNKNSFGLLKPIRRRRPAARKATKARA